MPEKEPLFLQLEKEIGNLDCPDRWSSVLGMCIHFVGIFRLWKLLEESYSKTEKGNIFVCKINAFLNLLISFSTGETYIKINLAQNGAMKLP